MTNSLPPLPESRYRLGVESDGYSQDRILSDDAYTEEDMRAYAEQARADLLADAELWRNLYRRAINEANGLTNYVEDRPELRSAERKLSAIEAEARAAIDAAMKGQA